MKVIYELEPIGVNGALEATGVHFYCSEDHAIQDAIAKGYTCPTEYSKPEDGDEPAIETGTQCEFCGHPVFEAE